MTQPCGSVCGSCPLTDLCHSTDTDAPDVMDPEERGFYATGGLIPGDASFVVESPPPFVVPRNSGANELRALSAVVTAANEAAAAGVDLRAALQAAVDRRH